MAENPFTHSTQATPIDYESIAKSDAKIIGGARWFWWIAGLSVVNTLIVHSGGSISFVIGLGFTQMADGIFSEMKPIAFALDALALGFFFGIGWFAGKGRFWAFVVGIIAYALDAAIYLLVSDWMSIAFHGLGLFYMFRGAQLLRGAVKAAAVAPEAPPLVAPATPPAS